MLIIIAIIQFLLKNIKKILIQISLASSQVRKLKTGARKV